MEHILTLSPKGQITLPAKERKKFPYRKWILKTKGNSLILQPIEIKVVENVVQEADMEGLSALANPSFEFWQNDKDDIYGQFYHSTTDHESPTG